MASRSAPVYASYTMPTRKRKRKHRSEAPAERKQRPETHFEDVEYSAVVTPSERDQRRLAGLPLDQSPPPNPFPHSDRLDARATAFQNVGLEAEIDAEDVILLPVIHSQPSFKVQHLTVLIAMLHRSLVAEDYPRASRALSFIMRTEIHGSFVDLRHEHLWRTAGELLLCQSSQTSQINRNGFSKVRTLYDTMAIRHPWNRTWPSSTNAQDFKLAMFNLWIYVVSQEALQRQKRTLDGGVEDMTNEENLEIKHFELAEAEAIAAEIDSLMNTIPFIDDREFQRLRAHVALWSADLYDSIEELDKTTPIEDFEQQWLENDTGNQLQREPKPATDLALKATEARILAMALSDKLRNHNIDSE